MRHVSAAVLAIAGAALVLRLVGLQFGLPAVYNPDEVAIMARALGFAKGTLNPHNFLYPTLYFYVLFGWVGVYLGFVWLTGQVPSLAGLQALYFTDPTGIYTAGRLLGAIAGAAAAPVAYRLASRLFAPRAGIAAALFLAVAPIAVRDSHYVKHDIPATLLVLAAYVAMTRVWPWARGEQAARRDLILASAACGAAFSTHYYCVFLAGPLAWVVFQRWKDSGWKAVVRQLVVAAALMVAVFLLLSPFLMVEPMTAWRDITANREIVVDRAVASGAFAPALRYVEILWGDSIGAPVVVLGLAGAIAMLIAAPSRALLLLAFPIPFLLFIANTFPASRYLNPVLPFIAIFAGWILSVAAERWRARPWMFWAVVALCVAPGAVSSVRSDLFFRQTDTRTLALNYIQREIPADSTVLIQPYSVPLTPSRDGLVDALTQNVGSAEAASTKFQIQLSLNPYPSPAYRLIYLGRGGLDADKIYVDPGDLGGTSRLDALHRLGVAFVVIKRFNDPSPETIAFLDVLTREGTRMAAFSPYRAGIAESEWRLIDPFLHNTDTGIHDALERPGPVVEIWKLAESR